VGEGVELPVRHRSEERPGEFLVVALELGNECLASGREGDELCSPVGWVRLARDEPVSDECIHEPSDGSRCHLQRLSKDTLRHRTAPAELPEQVRASRCQPERSDRLGHVVVQHDHELEDAIEQILVLLKLGDSEVW
jgi:hypothetical protein